MTDQQSSSAPAPAPAPVPAISSVQSSFLYCGYLFVLQGVGLFFNPNFIVTTLFAANPILTDQADAFARCFGLCLCILGIYYVIAGRHLIWTFFRASILIRPLVIIPLVYLWYFHRLEVQYLLIGVQDCITAYWSYSCMRAYQKQKQKTDDKQQ